MLTRPASTPPHLVRVRTHAPHPCIHACTTSTLLAGRRRRHPRARAAVGAHDDVRGAGRARGEGQDRGRGGAASARGITQRPLRNLPAAGAVSLKPPCCRAVSPESSCCRCDVSRTFLL
eukprot:360624-Chlamydomonas_euryale.AAC.3